MGRWQKPLERPQFPIPKVPFYQFFLFLFFEETYDNPSDQKSISPSILPEILPLDWSKPKPCHHALQFRKGKIPPQHLPSGLSGQEVQHHKVRRFESWPGKPAVSSVLCKTQRWFHSAHLALESLRREGCLTQPSPFPTASRSGIGSREGVQNCWPRLCRIPTSTTIQSRELQDGREVKEQSLE